MTQPENIVKKYADFERYHPEPKNDEDDDYLYVQSISNSDVFGYFYYKIDKDKDSEIYDELLSFENGGEVRFIDTDQPVEYFPNRKLWLDFMEENNSDANRLNAGPRSIKQVANARWWLVHSYN